MARARVHVHEPKEVARRTEPVDVETLDKIHAKLKKVSVCLDPDPSSTDLRALFAQIRRHRTMVSRIFGTFLPRVARYRADMIQVDSLIAGEGAQILYTGQGLATTTNEKQRAARVRVILDDHHDAQADLKEDLLALEAVVAHARHVQEELRFAFEEASRGLTTLELEYRIEASAP